MDTVDNISLLKKKAALLTLVGKVASYLIISHRGSWSDTLLGFHEQNWFK